MGKAYKQKICVYCGSPSETGDHVFARAFFLPLRRANLPKVPCCRACNTRKANLERELSAVLPFAGRHSDALATLTTLVPSRLARNSRLRRELQRGGSAVWMAQQSGLAERSRAMQFSGESLVELFGLIVRATHAFHFRNIVEADSHVEVLPLVSCPMRDLFRSMLSWNGAARVRMDLGQKTFEYEGVLGVDNPQISVWAFEVFGGIHFSDGRTGGVQRLILGATIGPRQIEERASRLVRWRQGRGADVQPKQS